MEEEIWTRWKICYLCRMYYDINFRCPEGWTYKESRYTDEMGVEVCEISANADRGQSITVSACQMPSDETAEDQAFANYIDCVGFDGDEQNGEIPVQQFTFNNRKAYGFASYDENGNIVRLFTQEVRRGVLATFYITASTLDDLNSVQDIAERNIRIK